MILGIKFQLSESFYSRDPQDTELGKKILKHSILLMDEIGFEAFTFRKLAVEIGSVEKSIYRYFENKHLLLLFLTSWYWEWVHYLININIKNIEDPNKKLEIAIRNIVEATSENASNEYINESVLHRVVINEGSKSYHTFAVDDENKVGLFWSYKSVVNTVADLVKQINPEFPYAVSQASSLFEMANNQIYFAQHLPSITNLSNKEGKEEELIQMLIFFARKLLS
ncbi:MAG: AcrR family transcriptional regulator [Saprospiraceae bacterium]|jgi:AcrR family transcriptional regulator